MALSNAKIKSLKPKARVYKATDEKGLYLEVQPNGGFYWRFKYRHHKKEKRISLGVYPDVSLKRARLRRDEARALVADGIDPSAHRQAIRAENLDRAENSFEAVAREWLGVKSSSWVPNHSDRVLSRLKRFIFPKIGSLPISEITAPQLLKLLRVVEGRGTIETAHRVSQECSQIFRYGIVTGRVDRDPAGDLKGALKAVPKGHFAAITDPKEVGVLLRAIDAYPGNMIVQSALRLAPLVFLRPGELRMARWEEIDFEKAEWNIPKERMKMREPHLVPLSHQACKIIEDLKSLTGNGEFVFKGFRSNKRPISNMALLAALRSLGYSKEQMTAHGFRAMARTLLDEELGFRPDHIEQQLAHAVKDPNGRAYNRTKHLPERRRMMQVWADYLDGLKDDLEVIPLRAKTS